MSTTAVVALKASITRKQPFCSGTVPLWPKNSVIFYKDGVKSSWIDLSHPADDGLQSLTEACDPATFGVNQHDVLDETYRKAGKMDNTDFATTFDLGQARLLDIIRAQLLSGSEESKFINAELYKLNVYGKDSFFKAHKDTPRGETMFGSLVLIYPTQHEGGALVLRHGGEEWTFDSAEAVRKHDSPAMGYVAFFSDVEREVAVVTSGYRITLTYNLYFTSEDTLPTLEPAVMSGFEVAFTAALKDPAFLPNGGLLGFGLSFQYPVSPVNTDLKALLGRLKGGDAAIKRVCDRLSLEASLKAVYLDEDTGRSIMVGQVPDLDGSGEINEPISHFLCNYFGGRVIYDMGEEASDDSDGEELPAPIEVLWVTPQTDSVQFKSSYIAYGNEASLECIYGDVCLVVKVGPTRRRTTKAA